jgi:MFS family permease
MLPFAGLIIARLNTGRALLLSMSIYILSLLWIGLADDFWSFTFALFYFGFSNSFMDISMNSAAAIREKQVKRNIMSTCHGMWSLGAMAGSVLGSVAIGFDVTLPVHFGVILVLEVIILILFTTSILNGYNTDYQGKRAFALPNFSLLSLSLMAFCIMLAEGAIADWSSLYMEQTLNSIPILIGMAYGSYSLIMAIGRFTGDYIIPKFGKRTVVLFGGLVAAIGLGTTLLVANEYYAILGFGLTGLGYSCVVPVLFSSAANEPGYTQGAGIAAVSSLGYFGFLIGPPAIGFLADGYGLESGLTLVVFLSFLVAIVAMLIRFR